MGSHRPQSCIPAGSLKIREALPEDLPAILEISNWAIRHTAASFRTEPETLNRWIELWRNRGERHPWFVAETDSSVVG